MLHYLQHLKNPCKMSLRDFSAIWNQMFRHTELLERHYKGEPNETERKLMYIRTYPKPYHQKFISHGKIFEQMSKEDITQYFQILNREEEETKPRGTLRTEGNSRGTGGHATNENHRGSRRNLAVLYRKHTDLQFSVYVYAWIFAPDVCNCCSHS